MADKSPRSHMSKKASKKTIKEKRADKQAKGKGQGGLGGAAK